MREVRQRETAWQALMRPPWRFLCSRWPWLGLGYLLISAVLGTVLLVVGVVTLVALPLWGILVGAIERRRTRLLGFPTQPSSHVRVGPSERHNWLGIRVAEVATWRETVALLLDAALGPVCVVLLFFEGLTLVVIGGIGWIAREREAEISLFWDVTLTAGPGNWWVAIPILLAALALLAYVNTLLVSAQAALLRVLCGPRQSELDRNVERLTRSRAALVQAFETEQRRIERDLHDGVQQELVTLAARLGLVSLELEELERSGVDAGPIRAALGSAQDQAEHAMASLRDTVRGIHPAVLADAGLAAALHELADRTAIPLRIEAAPGGRFPTAIETAAYYLVTETISNAAKHTSATRVTVRVAVQAGVQAAVQEHAGSDTPESSVSGTGPRTGRGASSARDDRERQLIISASDNGHGGADEARGTGIRGLRERAETLGGSFTIESPRGGPTTLAMMLPVPVPVPVPGAAAGSTPQEVPGRVASAAPGPITESEACDAPAAR